MIEINLLPEELRNKAEKPFGSLTPSHFLYLIPLFFGLLIIFHVILSAVFLTNNIQLNSLAREWQKLAPEKNKVDLFQKEYRTTSLNTKAAQQFLSKRVGWSEKVNKLSAYLPNGVWFNEIALTPGDFTIKGSIVSLQKDEMSLINKFISKLKSDEGFFKDFRSLELNSVQKKVIGSYDVVDFTLLGTLKSTLAKPAAAKSAVLKQGNAKAK